ncbi:type II toxin-antitoxin system RelE/ParE family toxin [Andreprevotia chitinilytica]|uniref:type II toxin-antitoxin system RelE/ParE family toxin n=1 Tax=Andreprevotia chitinilytica TaxID=396808 RepID=UPI00054CE791|nr:type II toxin-antitoxin system RelE/ParE family toxin [Andreprevotia chitinilytica]
MRLVITPLAERDIEAIGDYIAQDSPKRAASFVIELHSQCLKIASAPHIYRLRHELGDDIRSCTYGKYVIFFQVASQVVHIVRVLHGARDIRIRFSEPDSGH